MLINGLFMWIYMRQAVTYKGRVYEIEKFHNADERIFVYAIPVNSVLLLYIGENFWSGISGSSVFGTQFQAYAIYHY